MTSLGVKWNGWKMAIEMNIKISMIFSQCFSFVVVVFVVLRAFEKETMSAM